MLRWLRHCNEETSCVCTWYVVDCVLSCLWVVTLLFFWYFFWPLYRLRSGIIRRTTMNSVCVNKQHIFHTKGMGINTLIIIVLAIRHTIVVNYI